MNEGRIEIKGDYSLIKLDAFERMANEAKLENEATARKQKEEEDIENRFRSTVFRVLFVYYFIIKTLRIYYRKITFEEFSATIEKLDAHMESEIKKFKDYSLRRCLWGWVQIRRTNLKNLRLYKAEYLKALEFYKQFGYFPHDYQDNDPENIVDHWINNVSLTSEFNTSYKNWSELRFYPNGYSRYFSYGYELTFLIPIIRELYEKEHGPVPEGRDWFKSEEPKNTEVADKVKVGSLSPRRSQGVLEDSLL